MFDRVRCAVRLLRLACVLACLVSGIALAGGPRHRADEQAAVGPARQGRSFDGRRGEALPAPEALAKARSKWASLSPERRAELAEAWQKLQKLPPEERAKLVERAERLREMRGRFEAELPADARRRLEGLGPEQRERALRELMHAAWRERGAQLREKLPDQWRHEFETLSPEERAQRMARFHESLADRGLRMVLEKTAEQLGLPASEVERLQALPFADKEREARALLARLSPAGASKLGLKSATRQEVDALCALPVQELVALFLSARLERDLRAKGLPEERVQALAGLARALEPRQEDWTTLQGVPEAERRPAIEALRRTRTLEALRASGLVPAAELARLQALDPKELSMELRKTLEGLGLPSHRGWRGRGRDEHGPGERGPGEREPWQRDGRGRKDGDRPRQGGDAPGVPR